MEKNGFFSGLMRRLRHALRPQQPADSIQQPPLRTPVSLGPAQARHFGKKIGNVRELLDTIGTPTGSADVATAPEKEPPPIEPQPLPAPVAENQSKPEQASQPALQSESAKPPPAPAVQQNNNADESATAKNQEPVIELSDSSDFAKEEPAERGFSKIQLSLRAATKPLTARRKSKPLVHKMHKSKRFSPPPLALDLSKKRVKKSKKAKKPAGVELAPQARRSLLQSVRKSVKRQLEKHPVTVKRSHALDAMAHEIKKESTKKRSAQAKTRVVVEKTVHIHKEPIVHSSKKEKKHGQRDFTTRLQQEIREVIHKHKKASKNAADGQTESLPPASPKQVSKPAPPAPAESSSSDFPKELHNAMEKKAKEAGESISKEQLDQIEQRLAGIVQAQQNQQEVIGRIAAVDPARVLEGFTHLAEMVESHSGSSSGSGFVEKFEMPNTASKGEKGRPAGVEKTLEKKELFTEFDRILELVHARGQIKLSELAENLGMDKTAVKEACDILEENNLILQDFPAIGEARIVDINLDKRKKKTSEEQW